jgi:hypothetical protein
LRSRFDADRDRWNHLAMTVRRTTKWGAAVTVAVAVLSVGGPAFADQPPHPGHPPKPIQPVDPDRKPPGAYNIHHK